MKEMTTEPDFPLVKQETLDKLASRDKELRDSGALDIFEQFLPAIPPEYIFKNRDRQFVADTMHVAFDLNGGVARLAAKANKPVQSVKPSLASNGRGGPSEVRPNSLREAAELAWNKHAGE